MNSQYTAKLAWPNRKDAKKYSNGSSDKHCPRETNIDAPQAQLRIPEITVLFHRVSLLRHRPLFILCRLWSRSNESSRLLSFCKIRAMSFHPNANIQPNRNSKAESVINEHGKQHAPDREVIPFCYGKAERLKTFKANTADASQDNDYARNGNDIPPVLQRAVGEGWGCGGHYAIGQDLARACQ